MRSDAWMWGRQWQQQKTTTHEFLIRRFTSLRMPGKGSDPRTAYESLTSQTSHADSVFYKSDKMASVVGPR